MKIMAATTVIIIHILFHMNISMKKGCIVFAKCVVVSDQRKQQSGEQSNKTADEKIRKESTIWVTVTTPCYYCNHHHLYNHYEDQYQIIATLNAEDKKLVENTVDEQKRWREVIIEAMEVQQAKHYKHSLNLHHNENNNNESVDVQILKTHCSTRTCTQTFVVLYNDEPIPAEVKLLLTIISLVPIVVSDLSLLSLPRISARLRIPVESITTLLLIADEKSQWWIVAVVIGIAASIIATGWLCLFVYYNSCGRPYTTTAEKPLIQTIFLKDKFIQTAENDNGSMYFEVQPQNTESNEKKSLKTSSSENGSLSRVQKDMEDTSIKDIISETTVVTTSTNTHKQCITDQQQFDYPISIITRPKRRDDLRVHKLESRGNISVPTLKEICVEGKLHPHPIPPTTSGILEVRNLTQQIYRNPMSCL
uniref:Phlebovirus glycoprotein G2 fusion domain-containing protein n=1 Tax=Wuchereria bancrofti TaxID=6293 RepID=A0AAF5PGG4_WUCBA